MDTLTRQTSNEPPARSTNILGSFLRGRPRNPSQGQNIINTSAIHNSTANNHNANDDSSSIRQQPPSPSMNGRGSSLTRRRASGVPGLQHSPSQTPNPNNGSNGGGGLGISSMLRRRRSQTSSNTPQAPPPQAPPTTSVATAASVTSSPVAPSSGVAAAIAAVQAFGGLDNVLPSPTTTQNPMSAASAAGPSAGAPPGGPHRIRLVPHLESRRSLRFEAISRDLREGDGALRIGRFTDRSGLGLAAVNAMGSNKLAFKSKVVSRAHAEIWVDHGGKFYIKDTKSSSGTFLNHVRLSPANTESKPHQMKDGDVLQLGVDYQGGTEDIYKSVKIRIEVGREWQAGANAFNTTAMKNLKTLANDPSKTITTTKKSTTAKNSIPDCCICLFGVTIRQALFIAPCSHTFHYKCIRPLLESHHPAFSCPLCRTFADLEEDVEVEIELEMDVDDEDDDQPIGDGRPEVAASLIDGVEGMSRPGTGLGDAPIHSHAHSGYHQRAPTNAAAPDPHVPVPAVVFERAREAEREREAGVETDVERDGLGGSSGGGVSGTPGQSRAARRRSIQRAVDAGDDDEDMNVVDLTHAQAKTRITGSGSDGEGSGASGEDGVSDMVDMDETVNGKRKR